MFAERLKLARKRVGLSLRDLSDKTDGVVSAQAIGKYERGEMMPSSSVALKLAKSLDVSLAYLFSSSNARLERVDFRKVSTTKASEKAMVEATALDHVDRYLLIEELLDIGSHEWDKPKGCPYQVDSLDEAEEVANKVRKEWNLGGDAIPSMTNLLEEHGIKVLKLDFPLSVDGLTCEVVRPDKENVPVIVGSGLKSVERRRFTLAHELGHMLMQVQGNTEEEKACHRFASAFLMPKDALFTELGKHRKAFGYSELIEVKRMFGVSAAALVVRLNDLGVINDSAKQNIFRGIGRTWRKEEPSPIEEKEFPKRFERLVFRALAEDVISLPKAAELLGKKTSQIQLEMSGPTR